MAELEIGKQCSVLTCKQLDFLPFTCADCSLIFCLEHRSTTSHNCHAKTQVVVSGTEDVRRNVSEKTKCFFNGCEIQELLPVKCEFCERDFCLRHRHQQDHSCRKMETTTTCKLTKEQNRVPVEKKEKTGRGGVRNNSRAAKVALMKMKMHAVGDKSTPQEERAFFSIVLPSEASEKIKPMFFSKNWSVGRIIDEIARICKLKNQNNQQAAKKLRLFGGISRNLLNISNTLEDVMNENPETITNGTELILEYVQES